MPKGLWVVAVSSLLGAACSSSTPSPQQPPLAACTATSGGQVSLGVAAYMAIDPTQTAGCAVFPANPSGSASVQYLVIAQSASNAPDDSQAFKLGGNPLAAPPLAGAPLASRSSLAQQFDLTLRRAERDLAAKAAPGRRPLASPTIPQVITPGSSRTFKVCGDLNCSTHPTVTATAKTVGVNVAVYVDNASPDTLTTLDLDSVAVIFDTLLYRTDTAAFGRESDIDGNGLVLVLMTPKVNSLVTAAQCNSLTGGFVAGYFYGGDLVSGFSGGNAAEVFFSMSPDPSGTVSCQHTTTDVKRLVPVTFVHEFQHMISFNQHFILRGGFPEDLWLNEGLSHYAEENGGRVFLPDTATFCDFVFGDLYNAGQYLAAPQNHFLVDTAGIGGLAERGAYWLFVRFLVDQFAGGSSQSAANTFTRSLEATSQLGVANVVTTTATSFRTIVERWTLANYVSDLPSFATPPELQYVKWQFRTAFPTFNSKCSSKIPGVFPLAPPSVTGSSAQLAGMLRAGSGNYYVMQQAPSAPSFTLLFSNSGGFALRAALAPQLAVLRLQ
ncbi:MAG TPA: hypothetical protein VEU74_00815 [Gemmatimonadales bacterium]|nr:hypothetical protein [Gemmatimonadales bacterium]